MNLFIPSIYFLILKFFKNADLEIDICWLHEITVISKSHPSTEKIKLAKIQGMYGVLIFTS